MIHKIPKAEAIFKSLNILIWHKRLRDIFFSFVAGTQIVIVEATADVNNTQRHLVITPIMWYKNRL